ncbi:unnamed protein product [Caenorhabditis auriculariae]|uniref:Uncharacterized protein n=1 Tax=Caenorhabditis auriculariae TaxID=2777116 RepID=A0A8S1H470_9PELO|nr:unnamed protein product [Caenorhabditis auriculariae]
MGSFWLFLLIGGAACRIIPKSEGGPLSEQENKVLFEKCGRFVSGNSVEGAPWTAFIARANKDEVKLWGTGTLISPRHVHSVQKIMGGTRGVCQISKNNTCGLDPADFTVRLNDNNAKDHPLNVKKVYVQKGAGGSGKDEVIFELSEDVSPDLNPACTPTGEKLNLRKKALVHTFSCDCCGICAPGIEKSEKITYDVLE